MTFTQLDGDREVVQSLPNPLGFYHYPRKMGETKAFQKLKSFLIKKHRDEIAGLKKSLTDLEKLKER